MFFVIKQSSNHQSSTGLLFPKIFFGKKRGSSYFQINTVLIHSITLVTSDTENNTNQRPSLASILSFLMQTGAVWCPMYGLFHVKSSTSLWAVRLSILIELEAEALISIVKNMTVTLCIRLSVCGDYITHSRRDVSAWLESCCFCANA